MPHPPDPDFDYPAALRACAAGEHAALESLYRQEGARLLGIARRIVGDTALAEDVIHDAFVNIWRGAASYDPARGPARAWMHSIARHLALNRVRERGRAPPVDGDTVEALAAGESLLAWRDAEDRLERHGDAARLLTCLEQLGAQQRDCIVHAYVDGLSHTEIAARLRAPLGTIKSWIQRSLKALRECLA